jgi:hypothetical protein
MTQLWAKMVDTDGDGNKEVMQLSDEDPTTLFTPEACEFWQAVPEGTSIGSVLHASTGVWWTGADWLEKRIAESPAPDDSGNPDYVPPPPDPHEGGVKALSITNAGDNYADASVRNQYDIGEGVGLVAEVHYNQSTGSAESVTIHNPGRGYEVGQTFRIEQGMDMFAWDRKNPTYTVVTITEVH